ncbi:MAG: hypothetical protein AB199_02880 [Parcubacteria bacterium C7867-004]|nr:MAG: hypothetical protein AB199_02880 [Parcubacteria bacterium C7867-004]
MGLFSFGKKTESIALIDIGSGSIGGGYAHFSEGAIPVMYYSVRIPIEAAEGEELTDAMLRTLLTVEQLLTHEGAPAMRRETGSGHADRILVSLGAPWQETKVVTKHIQQPHPFLITPALLTNAANEIAGDQPGRVESGRSVIATILNGYEIGEPFGKRANRADFVILSSSVDKRAHDAVRKSLRHAFHAHDIEVTAFAPAAYAVFRDLYPHQKDFIILDVSGAATDAAFVKRGLLSGVTSVPHGLDNLFKASREAAQSAAPAASAINLLDKSGSDEFTARSAEAQREWLGGLRDVFAAFAAEQALPRTLFLMADDGARDFLKRILESSELRSLWLSEEPLSIVPVSSQNLSTRVSARGLATADLFLGILALFHAKGAGELPPDESTEDVPVIHETEA